jgi:hypothetical protein
MILTTIGDEVFEVDFETKTWKRIANPRGISNLRTMAGRFFKASVPAVGEGFSMLGEGLETPGSTRVIVTEPLRSIE